MRCLQLQRHMPGATPLSSQHNPDTSRPTRSAVSVTLLDLQGPVVGGFGNRCRGSGCCLALSEQRLCWAAPWLLRSDLDTCLQVPSVSSFTETGRNAVVRRCQVPHALGQASCRAWSLWRPRGSHLVSLLVFNGYRWTQLFTVHSPQFLKVPGAVLGDRTGRLTGQGGCESCL